MVEAWLEGAKHHVDTAHHDARPTIRGWLGRKFVYGTGGAALAARHGDKLAPAVLTPTYAVTAAALLLRRPWAILLAALGLASGVRSVRAALPSTPERDAVATRLAVLGLLWAVRQESALLLRHWWPAAAAGALVSSRLRRSLVSALIVDTIMSVSERGNDSRLGIATMMAGRRLDDDLAYGAGLWWGALRGRSACVLLPRRPGSARPAT